MRVFAYHNFVSCVCVYIAILENVGKRTDFDWASGQGLGRWLAVLGADSRPGIC
jgi:hypothetical protein